MDMKKKTENYDLAQMAFKHDFLEHDNPFSLMQAFIFARQHGEIPPEHVLNFIGKAFGYYFKLKGCVSLDVIFGLKQAKPNNLQIYFIMYDVHMFRRLTGCNIPDAVEKVIEYNRKAKLHPDFYFSKEKLKDLYSRQRWAKKLDKDPLFRWDYARLKKPENKDNYLNKFIS